MERIVVLKDIYTGEIEEAIERDGKLYSIDTFGPDETEAELFSEVYEVLNYKVGKDLDSTFIEQEVYAQSYGFDSLEELISNLLNDELDVAIEQNEQDFFARQLGFKDMADVRETFATCEGLGYEEKEDIV